MGIENYLEGSLILSQCSKLIVTGFSSPEWFLGWMYSTRHEFPPVEWILNPIRKQFVIPITPTPLLHPRVCLVRLVVVTHRIHTWVRLLITRKTSQQGLGSVLWCTKAFHFDEIKLLIFFFVILELHLRGHFLTQSYERTPVFPSKSFILFNFYIYVSDHLWVIFFIVRKKDKDENTFLIRNNVNEQNLWGIKMKKKSC